MNNIVFLSKHPILPVIYFLCLLPIDRFFALHVLFLGWLALFLFPTKSWGQVLIILIASILHDVSYIYPLGLTGGLVFVGYLLSSRFKIRQPWQLGAGIFLLSQIFVFIDYGFLHFDTMTIVRLIISLIFSYFIFIQYKNDTRTH